MGRSSRRPQATPNVQRLLQRQTLLLTVRVSHAGLRSRDLSLAFLDNATAYIAGLVGVRGLRLALNTSVAVLVLSLPFAATAASRASTPMMPATDTGATAASEAARAQQNARGAIAASRNPLTANAEGEHPLQQLTISEGDTLATIANYFDVSVEALAFANGITDGRDVRLGQKLLVPPAEGALYKVVAGDTVESVAAHFKVDPSVIWSYNRLYFEPEHFAAGQVVFVRGAELPAIKESAHVTAAILAGPTFVASQRRTGSLSWPVAGMITQFFWWGHTGTDIAAPYGTGIGAADDGVVSETGWVAVGGIHVCVEHASGITTCDYHTSAVYVSVGQQVARGQIIAAVGLTGVTTGPHVHWECKRGSQFLDCLSL